jgi:lysophospholipase L1-like esterase
MGFKFGDRMSLGAVSQRTRLYVVLASPLVALLVTEAVVRLQWRASPRPTREVGILVRPNPDPRIRFEPIPGAVESLTYDPGFPAAPIEIEARINEQGFRGRAVSIPKPAGVLRVACIGDSHTFGHGVDEEHTWPRTLERALEHELAGVRVEVMNWGVNGYDTEQEVAQLEERIARYEPDLVLLQFFVNDTALRSTAQADEDSLGPAEAKPKGAPNWLNRLAQYSRSAESLATRITRSAQLEALSRTLSAQFEDGRPGWVRCRELLSSTQRKLEKDGIEFAVVLYPLLVEWNGRMLSHDPLQRVDEFCRDTAIPCFDLEPEFDGRDLDMLRVHPLDFHANGLANDIAGRTVARRIIESGLLHAALADSTAQLAHSEER